MIQNNSYNYTQMQPAYMPMPQPIVQPQIIQQVIQQPTAPPPPPPQSTNVSITYQAPPPQTQTFVQPQAPIIIQQQEVPRAGACYKCGRGIPVDDYCTFCGVFWCIMLFPLGLICLPICKKKKCSNCSTNY